MRILLLLALCALSVSAWPFRKQRYAVKMILKCGNKPANNVKVKLMEYDTGLDPDDELDEGRTDNQGFLRLEGSTRELGGIEPRLDIIHDCNDVEQKTGIPKPCQRKWEIWLPDSYVNGKKDFDMGIVNLEMELKEEERDCIN